MSVLSADLRRRIVERHHIVTVAELVGDGVPPGDIARWCSTGVVRSMAPGVLALGDALVHEPFATRSAALCLANHRSVLDPLSSAAWWAMPGVFRPRRPTVVPITRYRSDDVVERSDGIRLLSRAATWLGLARLLRPTAFAEWSDQVLGSHVPVDDAHRAVRHSPEPTTAGVRRAAAVLSTRRRWQRPNDRSLERRFRASMRRRGHHGLDGVHRLELADGFRLHLTVADHDASWGAEIDHRSWHDGRWPDAHRRWVTRRLDDLGWAVVFVDDRQLRRDFAATMALVAADLADRRVRLAAA